MNDFCPDAGLHVLKSAVQRAAHAGAFALTIGGDHSVAAVRIASICTVHCMVLCIASLY
jgi:arginase family enzyme